MLILTRKPGESIYIGDIKVTVVEIKGHQIRVGIDAPPEVRIYREEIYLQILEENRKAAEGAVTPDAGLEGLADAWKGRPTVGGLKARPKSSAGASGSFGMALSQPPGASGSGAESAGGKVGKGRKGEKNGGDDDGSTPSCAAGAAGQGVGSSEGKKSPEVVIRRKKGVEKKDE